MVMLFCCNHPVPETKQHELTSRRRNLTNLIFETLVVLEEHSCQLYFGGLFEQLPLSRRSYDGQNSHCRAG